MKLTNAILGLVAYYLIVYKSPFTAGLLILLSANYYLLYEYSIIGREYALELFFICLICTLYSKRFEKQKTYVALLSLLTLSHIFGAVFAFGFAIAYLYEFINRREKPKLSQVLFGMLYLVSLGAAILSQFPPPDAINPLVNFAPDLGVFMRTAHSFIGALFLVLRPRYWMKHSSIYSDLSELNIFSSVLFILLISWLTTVFRKRKDVLIFFLISFFGIFLAIYCNDLLYYLPRYPSQIFLLILVAGWIFFEKSDKLNINFRFYVLLLCVFATLQAYSGLMIFVQSIKLPFSQGAAVSAFIDNPKFEGYELIVDPPYFSSAFLVYSKKQFFNFGQNRKANYILCSNKDADGIQVKSSPELMDSYLVTNDEIFKKHLQQRVCERQNRFLIITNYAPDEDRIKRYHLKLEKHFDEAVMPIEEYYVFSTEISDDFCDRNLPGN